MGNNNVNQSAIESEGDSFFKRHFKAAATAGLSGAALGTAFTSVAVNLNLLELNRVPFGLHVDLGIVGAGLIYALARKAPTKTPVTSKLSSAAAYTLASGTVALAALMGSLSLDAKRGAQEEQDQRTRSASEIQIDCAKPAEVAEAVNAFKGQSITLRCKP